MAACRFRGKTSGHGEVLVSERRRRFVALVDGGSPTEPEWDIEAPLTPAAFRWSMSHAAGSIEVSSPSSSSWSAIEEDGDCLLYTS